MKKTIAKNQRNWNSQLKFSLWASQVTPKQSMGKLPFELLYGKVVVFLIQLAMLVARLPQEEEEEISALTQRINRLVELHENRE